MINSLTKQIDIAIVGAGPQALTLVTHILQKSRKYKGRLLVFDPSGKWLYRWREQLAKQEIIHLRSPAVHHPHPDPYALRKFAEDRSSELFAPYDLPGTKLFNDFCEKVIDDFGLLDCVIKERVTEILPIINQRSRFFKLILGDGKSIIARRVVLATGGGNPVFPNWVGNIRSRYPGDRLVHSQEVDLRKMTLAGEKILIVGGGLSSGHLALGAIKKGARVSLIARREFQEKLFDADPGWLGPKYLKGFLAELDYQKRWDIIQAARNGGSLTPAIMLELKRALRQGLIDLSENCEVIEAIWLSNQWHIICQNGLEQKFDRIWLATSTQLNATENPLLVKVLDVVPQKMVNGLPILDKYLRLPKTELFIMGRLAALELGPTARNLSGGIRASRIIAEALVKPSLAVS